MLAAVATAPAIAGTLAASEYVVSYTAAAGEANRASFQWEGDQTIVSDPGVTLLVGCLPRSLTTVAAARPPATPSAAATRRAARR